VKISAGFLYLEKLDKFSLLLVEFMSICIAICDDTAEDIKTLSEALYAYDASFNIISYSNGETLIDDFLECKHAIDILFLDIYMPGTDGIKIAERIRRERKNIKIIFITSSNDHYPQAYEVFAFNYILKPLDRKRLYHIMDQALDEFKKENNQRISFSYRGKVYNVNYRDILYIESRDKFSLFHTSDGETMQCYNKLDSIEKELPSELFIRCHKSFIVNTSHITEMGGNYFRIGQVVISISKKHLKLAKERYFAYLFSHMGRGQL